MYNQIDANKRKTTWLILLFILFISGIGWFFGYIMGYGYGGLVFAGIFSLIMALTSYYGGDKVALATTGARQIQKEDHPTLYRLVENLCITAGLPLPKIYIIQDDAPNAFATGRNPQHASVAVTTGLLNRLDKAELEGVIAHELAHIKNYDILIMTIVIVLVGLIAIFSDMFLRVQFFGLGGRDNDNRSNTGSIGAILMIVALIVAALSPLIAKLIQLSVSRKREYLADASGSLLTRYPEGLASALEKIASYHQPMKRASTATAHLFIASPFFGRKRFTNLFSTHPPIEERIKRLRKMA